MPLDQRIDASLARALSLVAAPEAPPRLASALPYAIFPGGARIRPQLCIAVARACGDDDPGLTDAAAAAIERRAVRFGETTETPLSGLVPRLARNRPAWESWTQESASAHWWK